MRKKSEHFDSEAEHKDEYDGIGGDLTDHRHHKQPQGTNHGIFLEGWKRDGYDVGDINGAFQDSGFTISQVTITKGWMESMLLLLRFQDLGTLKLSEQTKKSFYLLEQWGRRKNL